MKVSVLIAAYQADRFIETALASVRAQAHRDWEVIVVEDGSLGATREMVESFAKTCRQSFYYERLPENRGVAAVRNRLLDLATGEALAFLDADDTWEPSHLAAAVSQIENGADIVVSGVRTFDLSNNQLIGQIPAPANLVREPLLSLFRRSIVVTSSAVVFTRELADRVGRFDETLRIGEDRDYWMRCAIAHGRFRITRGLTCNYSKHSGSSMAKTQLVARDTVRFYEKYQTLELVPRRLRRHLLAQSLVDAGRLLRRTNRAKSARCFLEALRCEPLNLRILLHLVFTGWARPHSA
jgi:glycosyltransferase involved in cell wall biosynthesis